jgi:hypothetical protein
MAETKKEIEKTNEPEEFMQKIIRLGYPMADVVGKVVIIPREEKELISLGFADYNGRKQIVITFTKEYAKAWMQDAITRL